MTFSKLYHETEINFERYMHPKSQSINFDDTRIIFKGMIEAISKGSSSEGISTVQLCKIRGYPSTRRMHRNRHKRQVLVKLKDSALETRPWGRLGINQKDLIGPTTQ